MLQVYSLKGRVLIMRCYCTPIAPVWYSGWFSLSKDKKGRSNFHEELKGTDILNLTKKASDQK